jgi:hypothetical protein
MQSALDLFLRRFIPVAGAPVARVAWFVSEPESIIIMRNRRHEPRASRRSDRLNLNRK